MNSLKSTLVTSMALNSSPNNQINCYFLFHSIHKTTHNQHCQVKNIQRERENKKREDSEKGWFYWIHRFYRTNLFYSMDEHSSRNISRIKTHIKMLELLLFKLFINVLLELTEIVFALVFLALAKPWYIFHNSLKPNAIITELRTKRIDIVYGHSFTFTDLFILCELHGFLIPTVCTFSR